MSLSYAEELRAQVVKFEQEIRKAETAGKDCDGDRVSSGDEFISLPIRCARAWGLCTDHYAK